MSGQYCSNLLMMCPIADGKICISVRKREILKLIAEINDWYKDWNKPEHDLELTIALKDDAAMLLNRSLEILKKIEREIK